MFLCITLTAKAAIAVVPVDWSSGTSGFIGGTGVTLSISVWSSAPLYTGFDASGHDFAAAP